MEMGDTDLSRFLKLMSNEKQLSLTMILYYWTEMLTAVKYIHENGKNCTCLNIAYQTIKCILPLTY